MNRKFKALGLTLFAILAMGALSASAASAADFHSENAETVLKGSQVGTDVFTVNAGTVKCNEATYEGVQSGTTAASVKVTPKYSGCTAFGFVNAPIDSSVCRYSTFGSSFIDIECDEWTGELGGVKVGHERPLTVTAFNCWITVHSQTALGLTYTNTGAGASRDLDINISLSGIKYTQHSKSFPGCAGGSGTFYNGTYTGAATVRGFTTGGTQVGIWRA